MSLAQQITDDMKKYMREKNQVALGTVRMLKSDIKYAEIEKKETLSDDDVIKIVQSAIKKRRDAAEQYANADRQELADKEKEEITFLEGYLPEQLTEEEVQQIVKGVIAETGITDQKQFGLVMKAVMAKVQGKADGKIVSRLVKEVF